MDADFIQEPSELHNQYNQDRVLRSYVQRQLPESVRSVVRPEHGAHSRVHQMLLASLFVPSTDMYGCPLAMTDGAARTLLEVGREPLIDEAVPRLTSRDPETFWTSGQWMTELSGRSDVGRSRTTAERLATRQVNRIADLDSLSSGPPCSQPCSTRSSGRASARSAAGRPSPL